MQRLTAVAWSMDDRYIYSGSDEMNIRIWKARANEKLGVVSSQMAKLFRFVRSLIGLVALFKKKG